ncbi:histone-lysine N-methyltransferase setd3 isoform X1 [Canna indica]|uniref:Histone-lysine N-methyltransferase setd3 isoform X1 n=1 Tax=Canna indica TaxID=4628 RepID=A0AAQ3QPV3_9LILI|nr:histone-lysine N-methyltransferase setd3 isoform X1 [Canna indica]
MAASAPLEHEAKLHCFLQWLQANWVQLRGCDIRFCGPGKGFGVYSTAGNSGDGVVMVVPLDLAITPMRVLQDQFVGPRCRALFEEGDVDDRFLVMVFLMVERLRPKSVWKPYFDLFPSTFGSTVWFSEDDLAELKGTTLYRASLMQRKQLLALFNDKVKNLVEELLHCDEDFDRTIEVQFEDFLWANSIFWTRALNIPFPRSYVFPESLEGQGKNSSPHNSDMGTAATGIPGETSFHALSGTNEDHTPVDNEKVDGTSKLANAEIVWVEGLIPGIDFCNHGLRAAATWEVDSSGIVTGIPVSMYLMLADQQNIKVGEEIYISYGNKGNEELLYLYGFVLDNNPDDYLMVHYPMEAFQNLPLSNIKAELLEAQKAELRCLLPKSLLDHGFFSEKEQDSKKSPVSHNYSWSGVRKAPSYLSKLIFSQEFLMALRTIAMQEHELRQVTSLLEELGASGEERQPSDIDVQTAIWEVCGDYGALELLVELLRVKMTELEEGSGTEDCDDEILKNFVVTALEDDERSENASQKASMSRTRRSCVVYRKGQKQLTRLFLREAEHALEICSGEQP